MKNVVIFASGSGTNANNLLQVFKDHDEIRICAIFTNNKNAGVVDVAMNHGIPCMFITKEFFYESELILSELFVFDPSLIVLAGFLWLIPPYLINKYPSKIINIHPALLPKYGGNGMYGSKVHEAVLKNKEKESGVTIHFVNERFDEGKIIHQAKCDVLIDDTIETLSKRIHHLEYSQLPKVVEEMLLS